MAAARTVTLTAATVAEVELDRGVAVEIINVTGTATVWARVDGEEPTVAGPPVTQNSPSPYLAYVTVPTDVGGYTVLLAREGDGTPWLVERITPPPELGP